MRKAHHLCRPTEMIVFLMGQPFFRQSWQTFSTNDP
jgi:hypothetical protein